MGELNMRFPILQHTSERLLRNAAIVLIAGFGAGCSADTMRFTDGLFTGSTSNQQRVVQQSASNNYPPVAAIQPASSGSVQRNSLPPVGSAPVAATQAQNQVNQAQNVAANRVNGAVNSTTTQVASAAGTAVNANSKVLGQLPSTADGVPLPAASHTPAPQVQSPVAAPQTAAAGGGYTVKSGESLFSIAQKHNVPVEQLKQANGLTNGAIRVGQNLVIPTAAGAATQVAATSPQSVKPAAAAPVQPASIASSEASNVKPYTPPQASNKVIEDAEKDQAAAPSSTGISQMRWPVRGRVLTSFGQRDGTSVNDGIDIMVPEGTAVKAAENGVVIYAGDGLKEFGQTVLIRHDNGLVTVYGHNSQILVQRGQKVRRGEDIAKSGMSGNAKSPKLHFEVRKNSSPVNPSKYLET